MMEKIPYLMTRMTEAVSMIGVTTTLALPLRHTPIPEVALDLIFGAAMYRMATGHEGLTPDDADAIVATASPGPCGSGTLHGKTRRPDA